MYQLHRLAYEEKQDGAILRQILDLLYPERNISITDAPAYLVYGYFFNHLAEFHKFVESIKSKHG